MRRPEDASVASEVLRMVSRRDRALAEEFLSKQKAEMAQDASEASDDAKRKPQETSEALKQRLSLARNLLKTNVRSAIQVADPALVSVTAEGIEFLSSLRPKDAAAADRRYAALLATATGNLEADVNMVSWLSSYLFSPYNFVTFRGGGQVIEVESGGPGTESNPVAVDPELRLAFFRTAAEILLRPLPTSPRAGQDQATTGSFATYTVIKRLLPHFEQFAPPQMTEALRAQMNALSTTMPRRMQRDDDTVRERSRRPRKKERRPRRNAMNSISSSRYFGRRTSICGRATT
jgi:hypothetical protein